MYDDLYIDKVKAKEFYIMAIEKFITIRNDSHSAALLQLQLFALQRSLVPLLQDAASDQLVSGLSIVMRQLSTMIEELTRSVKQADVKEKILATWDQLLRIILVFYDGVFFK
jgi:hypothetical protein